VLEGSGKQVRHVRFENAATLEKRAVRSLVAARYSKRTARRNRLTNSFI